MKPSTFMKTPAFNMTSLVSSLFNSKAVLSSRIESMKSAESALMTFAMNRFSDVDKMLHPHPDGSVSNQKDADSTATHTLRIFDTKIPQSAVPLKKGRNGSTECQVYGHERKKKRNEKAADDDFVIHGIEVTSHIHQEDKTEAPLVLLHGYMNGALYFYRNLLGLSNQCFGGTVYALDMLGWGLSSRPRFETTVEKKKRGFTKKKSEEAVNDETYAAEQVFVESLEEWRKAHKIDKMVLGGHSMGGYLSVAYSEKYPERVERLILLSPAGVPDDQKLDVEGRLKEASMSYRVVIGLVRKLYDKGVTPAAFLRTLPERRGRTMVENYIERRLPAITCPDERKNLSEYLYTNAALPGSGEDCLNKLLKPTAFGINPLVYRIPSLKVKHVSFIYGQNDWMDPSAGVQAKELCDMRRIEGNDDIPEVQVYGVRDAGHLLMLENWKEFNNAVIMSAGKEHRLPRHASKPFKVAESLSSNFFSPPRWGSKEEEVSVSS